MQVIDWYSELAETQSHPLSALYLAILEGEAGRSKSVQMKVHMWKDWALPYPFYGQVLQAAYLSESVDRDTVQGLQAQLAEQVPNGWFYRKVALNIAERTNNRGLQASLEAERQQHSGRLVSNNRMLGAAQMMAVVGGMMAMVMLWRRWKWGGSVALRVGDASIPPIGPDGMVWWYLFGEVASLAC